MDLADTARRAVDLVADLHERAGSGAERSTDEQAAAIDQLIGIVLTPGGTSVVRRLRAQPREETVRATVAAALATALTDRPEWLDRLHGHLAAMQRQWLAETGCEPPGGPEPTAPPGLNGLVGGDGGPGSATVRSGRRRIGWLIAAGALVLLLVVGITGYALVERGFRRLAVGTWRCDSLSDGDSYAFVVTVTGSRFTVRSDSAGSVPDDEALRGSWRFSRGQLVLHPDPDSGTSAPVIVSGVPASGGDGSYQLLGSNTARQQQVHATISNRGRTVLVTVADLQVTCHKQ
jgi:hypothetical protein